MPKQCFTALIRFSHSLTLFTIYIIPFSLIDICKLTLMIFGGREINTKTTYKLVPYFVTFLLIHY